MNSGRTLPVPGAARPRARQTEIAYTYGEPPADSIAAGFLRYLADEVGKDIVRAKGHRPCAELDKPLLCRPDR
ncbi:hypothetical protein [Streptomyces sp. NPDC018947]|uniref:hypothetical protein n=1 Tax=Streptomyces sp. NPDC018947 TaxID=3365054 RepID=UPI0037903CB0